MVLNIETTAGVDSVVAHSLEGFDYESAVSIDPREPSGRRVTRPARDGVSVDIVDVMGANHAAPRARQKLGGKSLVAIEGGDQALSYTITATLQIAPGESTIISVPSAFGALVLRHGNRRRRVTLAHLGRGLPRPSATLWRPTDHAPAAPRKVTYNEPPVRAAQQRITEARPCLIRLGDYQPPKRHRRLSTEVQG